MASAKTFLLGGVISILALIAVCVAVSGLLFHHVLHEREEGVRDSAGRLIDASSVPGDYKLQVEWVNTKAYGAQEIFRDALTHSLTPARPACKPLNGDIVLAIRTETCSIILYNPSAKTFQFIGFLGRRDTSDWFGDGIQVHDAAAEALMRSNPAYLFTLPAKPSQVSIINPQTPITDAPAVLKNDVLSQDVIRSTDEYCGEVDRYSNLHSAEAKLVAAIEPDYLQPNESRKPWPRYGSFDELQKVFGANEDEGAYSDQAYVLSRNDQPVLVTATYQGGSGDWVLTAKYCFSEGSLVRVESQLNTFHGNMMELRSAYFSKNGIALGHTSKYFDLKNTRKQLAAPRADFNEEVIPLFMRFKDSPFIKGIP